jgi:very-short-patch-repair endonuclease/predicted nucleic acid-binding Zn ribbon protein
MKCESCLNEHGGVYGSGRFCSSKCARGFSTKAKRAEINQKVSAKMVKPPKEFKCLTCLQVFESLNRRIKNGRRFCSTECANVTSLETRKKLSENAIRLHAEGKIHAWPSRSGKKPSYAEQYFIDLFENEKIKFEREVPLGRWYVDFLIGDLVLEVDGKQHDYEDRAASDKLKDEYAKSQGYKVLRIKRANPRTESGKAKLYPQITILKSYII